MILASALLISTSATLAVAFNKFVASVEARLEPRFSGQHFLWPDEAPGLRQRLLKGAVIAQPAVGNGIVPLKGKRINEVAAPGRSGKHELPIGQDRGLLWHFCGYWFYEERDGGVYIACESITLTRDIPFGMATLLGPVIHDLPGDAMRKSLEQTRKAVLVQNSSLQPK